MRVALLFLTAALHAQTVLSITGPTSVAAGKSAIITVSPPAAAGIATIQFTIVLPAGATGVAGTGATACGPTACLVEGSTATVAVHFAKHASAGKVPIGITGILAANVSGWNLDGLQAGAPLWIKVK